MNKTISIAGTITLAILFGAVAMPYQTAAKPNEVSLPLIQDNCVVRGTNNTPLRVRSTPGGRVIGSLKIGTHILAYGIEQDNNGNDWTKIKYRKGYGFVSTEFVSCG